MRGSLRRTLEAAAPATYGAAISPCTLRPALALSDDAAAALAGFEGFAGTRRIELEGCGRSSHATGLGACERRTVAGIEAPRMQALAVCWPPLRG